ncbi:predicted protein [Uncinocarpus reesii 1704]|uniref:Integrase zinc-binding domain-containing protein n=1 Tax=Uncinocarpus reesii (strain UAMH 1704) TaxID=336963 RepID=C4JMZ1_UNCRE|nr:uncharacterized protein UREG_04199 [Uncinocarpus reesii 1704]EEP79353.1 predicted protein [Uncinocarpus reesii 1704]
MVLDQQALRATRIKAEELDIKRKIKKVTVEDKYAKKIDDKNRNFKKEDGMILYHELIYVPRKIRKEVMIQEHDTVTSGHFSIDKTIKKIIRMYYWSEM